MKKSRATKALEQLARRDGVSVAEVRAEIQKAIDIALTSDDPAVQAQWCRIPCSGEKPTPEEVMLYLAKQTNKNIKEQPDY